MRNTLFLMLTMIVLSCAEDTVICKTNEDVSSEWFTDLKNSLTNCSCELSIIRARYQNQTVYYTALTDPLCNGVNTPVLLNDEGKVIKTFTQSPEDQEDFNENVTE